ncbi:hypothetical protein GCM10009547_07660 [Sporichthya brevicatena]|uniref:Uncharacterized protein n=1 Tax=Sporichthya brevicatena TaxID=171442 RepID=A0ABN1GBU9_9ACTN
MLGGQIGEAGGSDMGVEVDAHPVRVLGGETLPRAEFHPVERGHPHRAEAELTSAHGADE